MLAKHVDRWKALGTREALRYYMGTALFERAGVEIDRVFAWQADSTPTGGVIAADGDSFAILTSMDELSAHDRELLIGYGGATILERFEKSFVDKWLCAIARAHGELACVCWFTPTSKYEPANGKRCWIVQRCFTLPAQRGRGHYQRTLTYSATRVAREQPHVPILVESSIFNVSSIRGIEKAGFRAIGSRVEAMQTSQYFPAEPGGVRPWRQLVKRGLEATVPQRLLTTRAPAASGAVHLTFDDGPHPEHTPVLLDALRAHGARATFFVIGKNAERHPELIRRMVAEGHSVGSHSWSHTEPAEVSAPALMDEIARTSALLAPLLGKAPTLFRPPLGAVTAAKLARLWAAGQRVVLWSVDPRDYSLSSAQDLAAWFEAYPLIAGDVVLMHDTEPHAAGALPRLIEKVRARGLVIAPLPQS